MMTWGSKLGGAAGAPHTAQVRVVVAQELSTDAKKQIVTGLFNLLEPFAPKASSQICFVATSAENLAIDGLLLPDLIVRDSAAPAKGKKEAKPQQAKDTPEQKAAKEAAKAVEKQLKAVIKEGGKKGVEIEGASDMGGLDFFCTTIEVRRADRRPAPSLPRSALPRSASSPVVQPPHP